MKLIRNVICLVLCCNVFISHAQLYKIDLNKKIDKASLVIEGKVTAQHSFWNDAHNIIYTSSTIHVYKLFKGHLFSKDIEVVTQGGTVGDKCLEVSDVLHLGTDEKGMFFLQENALKLHSPVSKNILFDVYSSSQGFLRYDDENKTAFAPFAKYDDIENTLYNLIRQRTGINETIIDNPEIPPASKIINGGDISNGTSGAAIISFSPATVHAGAINDAENNVLSIKGTGFGNSPANAAGVSFKDANNDNTVPDYKVQYNSPYIQSWSDTQIVLNVPDRAATGKFKVITNDGTSVLSNSDLVVFFAVLDAEFSSGGKNYIREPRLMNTNGNGGYTVQFSTNTAGGGVDFTTSPAKGTFERALSAWKEIVGANITEGSPTNIQLVADDNVNVVLFDNNNTGVPKMADGVLESTYSWFSACAQGLQILTAQKTGFDILIRNNGVSQGSNISFEYGPCFPAVGTYDLEMIILHEIGHALNLSHINDDYENGGGNYQNINPSKLMHYSILDYVDRRSPDASAYQGALYAVTPQGNTYGSCGLFANEMSPLSALNISNDDCPSTFPSSEIQPNTTVNFDLIHATSNKFVDPSFMQVDCSGAGTSVTNNAYYAFSTGAIPSIVLTIKDYTTSPPELKDCTAQNIRMSLYDVQSCPAGQGYPDPVICSSFGSNGVINLNGLQPGHKYLLYFDGIRNTKASFNVVFNSDSAIANPGSKVIVTVGQNPVADNQKLSVYLTNINTPGATYQYILYDAVGRNLLTGNITAAPPATSFTINTTMMAPGIYFLRMVDENNKAISTTRIFKP